MGAVSRLPVLILVGIVYVVVVIILLMAVPTAGGVAISVGALVLTPCLMVLKTRNNNRKFEAARADLAPGEQVRFWWKAGFLSFGERWVVLTTERLLVPRPGWTAARVRSILLSEIYLADTSQRSIGVGGYGGGLIVGTTLSSRYLELDLVNGDVVKIRMDRPQVLQQRLADALAGWTQRQSP